MNQAKEIRLLISKNLRYFMKLRQIKSDNALAVLAGMSPNTVRNYVDPSKRTVTADKPEGYPVLDGLAKLAAKLDCDVWELLHPDIEKERLEKEMYENIKASLKKISEGPPAQQPQTDQVEEPAAQDRRSTK